MLTYRTATETAMSKFFAKFSGKWSWHVLPPHPSGFNKHIGKWHPPYRFTLVYCQNGNQMVIVLVCFLRNRKPSGSIHKSQENHQGQKLKEDKPKQAIPSQNSDEMVICQGRMEFVTHLTTCLVKVCPSNCVTRAPLLYFIRSWVALSFKVCE